MSVLWEIKSKHGTRSFIMGSMHVKDLRAFDMVPIAQQCIDQCSLFATETDLKMVKTQFQPSDLQLPNDTSLRHYYSEKQLAKMSKIFAKSFGIDLSIMHHLLPIYISQILANSVLNAESFYSLDEHLNHYAETNQKRTTGIETVAEQLKIWQTIPLDYQISLLKGIAQNVKSYRKQI